MAVGVDLSGSKSKAQTRLLSDEDNTGDAETTKSREASGSLGLAVGASSEQKGASLSAGAGGIQVASGGNVTLQGTQMKTDGAADIAAAGKVSRTDAVSSSVGFGLGLSGGASSEKTQGALPGVDADELDDADSAPDAVDAADAADAEKGAPQEAQERSAELDRLTLTATADRTRTGIDAAQGTTVRAGARPVQLIPGVSMTLRGSVQSDGTLKALVPVPAGLPAEAKVRATLPDGSPLPDWVSVDAETGSVSGQPPEGYEGGLSIVVNVPQADGSLKKVGVQF